jgi:hypothetical protein
VKILNHLRPGHFQAASPRGLVAEGLDRFAGYPTDRRQCGLASGPSVAMKSTTASQSCLIVRE